MVSVMQPIMSFHFARRASWTMAAASASPLLAILTFTPSARSRSITRRQSSAEKTVSSRMTGVAPTPFSFSNTTTLENGTSYLGPWHLEAASDATERFILVPFACKVHALYAWASTKHNQTGETVVLTVRKNGSDQTMLVSFGKDDTAKSDTTVGHAVTLTAGDRLSVKCVSSAASAVLANCKVGLAVTLG